MKLLTQDMTPIVNDLDDGFLSTVDDVAVIDVSGLKNISIYVNQIGDLAVLDLAGVTANDDTVIVALDAGVTPSIAFEDGAATTAGTIVEDVDLGTIVIGFKDNDTTVADVEALLATSELVAVLHTGTAATKLQSTDDEFASTPLALGVATFSLDVEKSPDGVHWSPVDSVTEAEMPSGDNVAAELTLSDDNGMPTAAKQVRITLSALDGTSYFTVVAAGIPL